MPSFRLPLPHVQFLVFLVALAFACNVESASSLDPSNPTVQAPSQPGKYWVFGDVRLVSGNTDDLLPWAAQFSSFGSVWEQALDYEASRIEPIGQDGAIALVYEGVAIPVEIEAGAAPLTFQVEGEGVDEWAFENAFIVSASAADSGSVQSATVVEGKDGLPPRILLSFSRPLAEEPLASRFRLLDQDGGSLGPHLQVRRLSSKQIAVMPVSGPPVQGSCELVFDGGGSDSFGAPFAGGTFAVDFPTSSSAGERESAGQAGTLDASGASLAANVALSLEETPNNSGLLTAFTSGTFTATRRANSKSFEIELEAGDQLSAYLKVINDEGSYRMRVADALDNDIYGGYWGAVSPAQRLPIETAGTYVVQVYLSSGSSANFDLRIDVGRGLFIEAEDNDSIGTANPLTFTQTSGGYQESAGGALADLPYNSGWVGSNDVNGDFFDFGHLSSGNAVDVTYQLSDGSTLEPGDLELALFKSDNETPEAVSVLATGLSSTISSDGRYLLRVAPNDNLDGTQLSFSGGTDSVELPAASLDGLQDYTLEFWSRGQTDGRCLFSAANGSQFNEATVFYDNATTLQFLDRGASYSWTVPSNDAQTWRHFAIVRNGTASEVELFVDGVSQGVKSGQSAAISVTRIFLGQDQDSEGGGFQSTQAFIGNIDELRIWSSLRSSSEIADNRKSVLDGNEAGLNAYWKFNDASGTLASDETANGYDATLNGVVFEGDVNAAGFNPAKVGIRAQYLASVNVTDSVAPEVVGGTFPVGTSDAYLTSLVVEFSEDLAPLTANDESAYELLEAGVDGVFDTGDDEAYNIEVVSYSRGVEVTIDMVDGPLQPGKYRLSIASSLTDRAGNVLAPFTTSFTMEPFGDFLIEDLDNDTLATATPFAASVDPAHDGSFTRGESFVSNRPYASEILDLDGDGDVDLINVGFSVDLFLNDGSGSFTAGASYALADDARRSTLGDFNGDGRDDLAFTIFDDDQVGVMINAGGASFSGPTLITVGDGPYDLATSDFDGDGNLDLVVTNYNSGDLKVLLGDGAGGFAVSTLSEQLSSSGLRQVVAGDFNGDANADIVFVDYSGDRAVFLEGVGDGSFEEGLSISLGSQTDPQSIATGDFDADGALDLLVGYDSYSQNAATVLYGAGDGTFAPLESVVIGNYEQDFLLADFNGDGLADLLAPCRNEFVVYEGTGNRDSAFAGRMAWTDIDRAWATNVADFNGDGRQDILAGSNAANRYELLLGNPTRRPLEDATASGFYQALGRGNLSDSADYDAFSFSAKRGESISVVASSVETSGSSNGLLYELFDSTDSELAQFYTNRYSGRGQLDPYTFTADGTYVLRVRRNYDYFGEYRFRATIAPSDHQLEHEDNGSRNNATIVDFVAGAGEQNAQVLGQLTEDDSNGDYYNLGNLATGAEISLTYANTEDSAASAKLWLYSSDGTIQAEADAGTTTLAHTVASSDTWYVRVTAEEAERGFFSEYRLDIQIEDTQSPQVTLDDLPAEGTTSDSLIIDFELAFSEDLLASTVNDASNYEFRNAGADGLFNTEDDILYALIDPAYVDGVSHTFLLEDNPLQAGKHRFTIAAGSLKDLYGNGLSGSYVRTFTIEKRSPFVHEDLSNETVSESDPISLTEDNDIPGLREAWVRGRGTSHATDHDYYSFAGEAGENALIEVEAVDNAYATHFVELLDTDESRLESMSVFYRDESLNPVALPATGTYFLGIRPQTNRTLEYQIRTSVVGSDIQIEDEANDSIGTGNEVVFEQGAGERTATLFAGASLQDSIDYFGIGNLAEGATITATFRQPADAGLTPTLRLVASTGSVVRVAGDAGDTSISYTLAAGEEDYHSISVSCADRGIFGRYFLDIKVEDTEAPSITSISLPAQDAAVNDMIVDFSLGFSEDLVASEVTDSATYELVNAGPDAAFDTGDDVAYALLPQSYTSGPEATLVIENGPLQAGLYRFRIGQDQLHDLFGNSLAEDVVRAFTVEGVQGYFTESQDNDEIATADSVSSNPNDVHDGSFSQSATYPASDQVRSLARLDVDGDGDLDLAAIAGSYVEVELYENDGSGAYGAAASLDSYSWPRRGGYILAEDFNNDGQDDLVYSVGSNSGDPSSLVVWQYGDGAGGFTRSEDQRANDAGPIASGDFNGDGWMDLAVVDYGSPDQALLYLNNQDETWTVSTLTDLGDSRNVRDVAVADFDGDGALDLVFADDSNSGRAIILIGNGDGTFAAPQFHAATDSDVALIAAGDFDGDGNDDFALGFDRASFVNIALGKGDGTFEAASQLDLKATNYQYVLKASDFDGDGLLDLAVGHQNGNSLSLFSGRSGAGDYLAGPQVYSGFGAIRGIASGDFDQDGRLDLMLADNSGDQLVMVKGNSGQPMATDTSVVGLRRAQARGTLRNGLSGNRYDFWTFSALAGDRLLITTENLSQSYLTDANFTVYGPGGASLTSFSGRRYGGEGQNAPYTIDYTGRVHVRVSDSNPSGSEYRINFNLVPAPAQIEDEDNDNATYANVPTFETQDGQKEASVFGTVDRRDTSGDHFFLGNLAGGTQVQIRLDLPDNSLLDPRLQVYRSGQPALAETDDGTPALDATIPSNEGGAYYLKIDSTTPTRGFLSTYLARLRLLDSVPPEILATSLPASASSDFVENVTLTINEDFDAEQVNDGSNFELRQSGPDGVFDNADDKVVGLGDPSYSGGSEIVIPVVDNPLPPGEYRFTARQELSDLYANQLSADYAQTFEITSKPGYQTESLDNASAESATELEFASNELGFLTLGGRGRLNVSSEVDYWQFEAEAGEAVIIDSDFEGDPNGRLRFLVTAPDESTLVQFDSDYNGTYTTTGPLEITQSGVYTIRISNSNTYLGEYLFRVTRVEAGENRESEDNDSVESADPLSLASVDAERMGWISGIVPTVTDRDYFNLGTVSAGETIFLSVEKPSGSPLNPVVSIYDANGTFVSEVSSGRSGDSVAEVDITSEGEYFALIRASSSSNGLLSEYLLSAQIVPTDATNFSNLQVTAIQQPLGAGIQSGDTVDYSYTVKNVGDSDTEASSWIDRVVISVNNTFGDGDDRQFDVVNRAASLASGASYTINRSAQLLDGVSGTFFIIVRTDTANQVDEFLFEGDNESSSVGTFSVALANYPDLQVESLTISEPTASGDVSATWISANRGDGAVADGFTERVEVIDLLTQGTEFSRVDEISDELGVDVTADRTLNLSGLTPSNYRLRITTEYGDDYFEFNDSGHTAAESNVFTGDFIVYRFFDVTAVADPANGGNVTGSGTVREGSSVTVTATPDTSEAPYRFVRWRKASGELLTTNPTYNFTPSADFTLVAEFELPLYSVSIERNIAAGGTVSGSGGYRWGSDVGVRANPAPGYIFERWENAADNSLLGEEALLPLTITENLELRAVFAEENPTHDVTVVTSPSDVANFASDGNYANGEMLTVAAPETKVDGGTEYLFQRWVLNGQSYSTDPDLSKTFSTYDSPTLSFVAEYAQRSFKPEVESLASLLPTSQPIPGGELFGVTLTFDRAMDTNADPTLTLASSDAASVPDLAGGFWINDRTWESGTLTFSSANTGAYTLSVADAVGEAGRVMETKVLQSFNVDATPPLNPSLSLSSSGDGFATVGWSGYAAPDDLHAFRVYLETAEFSSATASGALSGLGKTQRSFTFTGLELDKPYFAAVVAVDAAGNANNSVSALPVVLNSDVPPAVSPQLISDEPDSALLDWSSYDVSSLIGFDSFDVYQSETAFDDVSSLTPVVSLPSTSTTYRTGTLDRSKEYYFAVVGVNRIGGFNPSVSTLQWQDPLAGTISEDRVFGGQGQESLLIRDAITVSDGATLTIKPGTTLYMAAGSSITVQEGVLDAQGTALDPIVFTSAAEEPSSGLSAQAGDWGQILLADPSRSSNLQHAWILYGSGLEVAGSDPALDSVGIVRNAGSGLKASGGASVTAQSLYVAFNEIGLESVGAGSQLTVSESAILNNSVAAAEAGVDSDILAQRNWWTTAEAGEIASQVNGLVDTTDFLTEEPLLGLGIGFARSGTQTTNNQVDLRLGAMNASAYRISEDSTFAGAPFEDVAAVGAISRSAWNKNFELSEGAGIKTIFVQYLSASGSLTETAQIEIELLADGPNISAFNLQEGDLIERPVEVAASSSSPLGIASMSLEVEGVPTLSSESDTLLQVWDVAGLASDVYRLRLVAEDNSGNLATRTINITVDPQPAPPPALSSPANQAVLTESSVDVSGSAEPSIGLRVSVNGAVVATGDAAADGTFSFANVPLLEGSNQVVVSAFDAAGTSSSDPVTVISDTVSPLAPVIEDPLYDAETGLLIQWRFPDEAGERPSRYKVFWDTVPFTDYTTAQNASPFVSNLSWSFENQANQTYYFRVVGYDGANNASAASEQKRYDFDDTEPVISIFYDKPTPVGAGDLSITVSSNEELEKTPTLTIKPEGRRLPISVPLTASSPNTWTSTFEVSDASMASGVAEVLVNAIDTESNAFSGAPVGDPLTIDLTRPTAILRTNVDLPIQVLSPRQIDLTLELSEPVKVGTSPSLRWSPPSGAEVSIDLSGSESIWTGRLTLFPSMGKGFGSFLFSAEDAVENEGTLITSGQSMEIYNTVLPDPPGTPSQLLAQTRAGGVVDLEWLAADLANTYNLYRVPSSQSGIPNVLVAEGIAETSYLDTPPADGVYRYVVTASRLGAEGSASPSFTVTSDRTPPPPPENIAATLGTAGVEVSFAPPSGGQAVYRYVLYRNGAPLATSAADVRALMDHPPRGVMEYQVASSDEYGNHSLSGSASLEMYLGPVKDLTALVETGQPIRLTWEETDHVTEGFNLYRNGVRQNGAILTDPFYSDPLSSGGKPVSYAVKAVDNQGRESAPRQLRVQPLTWSMLLNPDDSGEEFDSVARFFDRYRLSFDNSGGDEAVSLRSVAVTRQLTTGSSHMGSYPISADAPSGAGASSEIVVPAPADHGAAQTVSLTASTEPDSGGGKVSYKLSRSLPAATDPGDAIELATSQPPLAGGTTDFTVTLTNAGRAEADFVLVRDNGKEPGDLSLSVFDGDGTELSGTLFETLISGLSFNGSGDGFVRLAPGENFTFTMPDVFAPAALAGSSSARFEANLDLLYHKVGSSEQVVSGPLAGQMQSSLSQTAYYGTSSTDRSIYSNDETIAITGQALDRDTDQPVANADLRLGFELQGFTFYEEVTTDSSGNYAFDYELGLGIAGRINLWAAHPDVVDKLEQTSFQLFRSLLSPASGDIRMSKNDRIDFDIELINPGQQPLTDFTLGYRAYTVDSDDNETEIDTISVELRQAIKQSVEGRGRAKVALRLISELEAPDNAVVEVTLTSAEGAKSTFTARLLLLPAIPVLDVVSPRVGYVDLTVNRGSITSQQVTITNNGLRALEDVELIPPQNLDWMRVNLPKDEDGKMTLPDLGVGESVTVGVVFTPPEDIGVGFYDDFLKITGSNAVADFQLNLFAQISTSERGNVDFYVDNNLVQAIPNASITMRNVALGLERGPFRTDVNGVARFEDLQAGDWSWKISAPSHQARAGVVKVVANQTVGVDARLGKSLVSIKFNVVPVPFTDRYEIKIEQTFETRVPAPVVVFDPPNFDFETNEPFEADVILKLTNHGLIGVTETEIKGTVGGRLTMTPLIRYIPTIAAQETIEIPARITFAGFDDTVSTSSSSGGGSSPSSLGGGARPQVLGGDYGPCTGGPADAEFLQGLAAIAKLGAEGGYACADGDLGTYAAVALASASGFKAALSAGVGGTPAKQLINILGTYLGCLSIDTGSGGGGGGGGGGPSHTSGTSGGAGGPGCFVAGTDVLAADGTYRPIQRLSAGDEVVTNADGRTDRIVQAYSLSVDRLTIVTLESGLEIVTTPDHRIWVDGFGWKPSVRLKAGDWLKTEQGDFVAVSTVEVRNEPTRVYTFQLESDSAFFANGVLVEDLCGGQNLNPDLFKKFIPKGGER